MPPRNKKKDLEDEAMSYYNVILERVEKMIGKKSTLSTELENAGRKLLGVKFKGVYPSDKIPKLNTILLFIFVTYISYCLKIN